MSDALSNRGKAPRSGEIAAGEARAPGAGAGYGESLRPGERNPAPYAAGGVASRGRRYPEPPCPTRSPFQRDRDRVLHATSFRRLMHKTQVFVFHEGDHYRTRLTHSLEVAQIARTIARQLRLDEDLAETLALAHDLGHPPFGHAGERALHAAMAGHGGFDHNAQSLRVVMHLERKYKAFDGLNLTWESLEGLAKHNGPFPADAKTAVAKVARSLSSWRSLEPERWASAEAQVAALSDDIAYVTHDIDDGLRAGMISLAELASASPFVARVADAAGSDGRDARVVYEVVRRMITELIADVIAESRRRLAALAPTSPDDIRGAGDAVVAFSDGMAHDVADLKRLLTGRVYRSPDLVRITEAAEAIVTDLFARYARDTAALPEAWRNAAEAASEHRRTRLVADFVAGMTDRYAVAEHRRLFDATPVLR